MKQTEWYKNAIVYQIYPFSFMDANNDGWGDIEGIISKLDYLKDLGITAIWFSPLYKSPDYDYGYDISDYRDIDPKFGTLDDFKVMLAKCHELGIKVIMDMVVNHTSIEHPWFKDAISNTNSPYRDYYIIKEGKKTKKGYTYPTNWDSTFTGPAWEPIKGTNDYYMHLFCVEQADLNWENEKVRQEVADIFNYWMDMGVDGFRLDVFNMFSKVYPLRDSKKRIMRTGAEYYIDGPRMHEYMQELNKRAFSKYDSYTVGESYCPHKEDTVKYVAKENHELDTIFDFGHLNSDNNSKFFKLPFNLKKFKTGLLGPQKENFKSGWNTLVLENHDNARSNSRFGIDVRKFHYEASTFLPTITFLGFGTPFIYEGEEFGMTNVHFNEIDDCKDAVSHFIYGMLRKFGISNKIAMKCINYGARDNARVPMRWDNSINNGFNKGAKPWQNPMIPLVDVNLEKDLASNKSIYRYYQELLKFRKSSDIMVNGNITEYNHNSNKIIAYSRFIKEEGIFVFGNFSSKTVKYSLPKEIKEYKKELAISNYDNNIENNGQFTLRPYEAIVYKLTK